MAGKFDWIADEVLRAGAQAVELRVGDEVLARLPCIRREKGALALDVQAELADLAEDDTLREVQIVIVARGGRDAAHRTVKVGKGSTRAPATSASAQLIARERHIERLMDRCHAMLDTSMATAQRTNELLAAENLSFRTTHFELFKAKEKLLSEENDREVARMTVVQAEKRKARNWNILMTKVFPAMQKALAGHADTERSKLFGRLMGFLTENAPAELAALVDKVPAELMAPLEEAMSMAEAEAAKDDAADKSKPEVH